MSDKSNHQKELWEFDGFRLDPRARLLLRDGLPVPLTPKAFDVLVYLARNQGRAVSREEFLAAIWPDTVVTDASLTQAVFLIRRALAESESTSYVETVPRVGYRLDLPESPPSLPAGEPAGGASAPAQLPPGMPAARQAVWWRRRPVLAVAVLVTCLTGAAFVRTLLRSPERAGGAALGPTGPGSAAPLISVEREIPVPPDAHRVLGAVDGTVVLAAPRAFYLLPADGALAASRVPLGDGEVAAAPLAAGRLVVVRGRRVVSRHPARQGETALGALPEDAPPAQEGGAFVSPSGRFLALRGDVALEVFERTPSGWTRRLRAAVPPEGGEAFDLTDRFVALAQGRGGPVRAWSLPDGNLVLEAPFAEQRVYTVAVDDARGAVAVAGAFDSVAVFSLSGPPGPRLHPRRGWTYGLAWIGDAPTLLASGQAGLAAFRDGPEPAGLLPTVSPGGLLHVDADFVLALVPERQRLALVRYSGLPPSARVAAGGHALWAAEHDAEGRTVFAGGRDGHLWVLDTKTLSVRDEAVHTDGIPALARDGDLLASSSDDKTVALWRLPGPRLLLRTRAHDFLVNDLTVAEGAGGRQLVTSSSDGTVKRWSWPALGLLESVDVASLLGRPVSFHALWVAPGAERILAGTWGSELLEIRAGGGRRDLRSFPVGSRAVYRFAPLPRLGLVIAVGILPSELHLFDLATGTLRPLETAGLSAFWAVAVPGKDEVLVVGLDGISRYGFSGGLPDAVGRRTLSYRVTSRRQTGAGLQTATLLPDGTLWAGTAKGDLVRYDASVLDGPPLLSRRVALSPEPAGPYNPRSPR